jgi:hypothetical protein
MSKGSRETLSQSKVKAKNTVGGMVDKLPSMLRPWVQFPVPKRKARS